MNIYISKSLNKSRFSESKSQSITYTSIQKSFNWINYSEIYTDIDKKIQNKIDCLKDNNPFKSKNNFSFQKNRTKSQYQSKPSPIDLVDFTVKNPFNQRSLMSNRFVTKQFMNQNFNELSFIELNQKKQNEQFMLTFDNNPINNNRVKQDPNPQKYQDEHLKTEIQVLNLLQFQNDEVKKNKIKYPNSIILNQKQYIYCPLKQKKKK